MSNLKRKPKGQGKSRGVRHPELHDRGGRAIQPTQPEKPMWNTAAPPNFKIVTLVRIDVGEWGRIPEMKRSHEAVTVTAVLSDGRTDARQAVCLYEAGEREKIMEQALGRKDNEAALIATKRLLRLRSMAVEKARGELQKLYANGVVV